MYNKKKRYCDTNISFPERHLFRSASPFSNNSPRDAPCRPRPRCLRWFWRSPQPFRTSAFWGGLMHRQIFLVHVWSQQRMEDLNMLHAGKILCNDLKRLNGWLRWSPLIRKQRDKQLYLVPKNPRASWRCSWPEGFCRQSVVLLWALCNNKMYVLLQWDTPSSLMKTIPNKKPYVWVKR